MNRLYLLQHQITSQHTLTKVQTQICPTTEIGFITLNSPKDLNSLSQTMINQIIHALNTLQQSPQVKAIVIKSSHAKIFCAGADIKRFLKQPYQYYVKNQIFHGLENVFKNIKKPIIAAVNGKAFGGGFELAMLCDIIIATEQSYFALPQTNLGLMPGIGGTQRLTRLIGQKMAMRHILTADGFDGKRAYQMNVCQLVKSQGFDQNVINIVKKITEKATTTMITVKRAIKYASDSNLTQGLEFQKSTFYPMLATRAAKEGITAFIEKRKADFKGM